LKKSGYNQATYEQVNLLLEDIHKRGKMNVKDVIPVNRQESFVNVTNDREAHPKRWVAALVQMNCEKKIGAKLDKLGVENYIPIQIETHQWSDRKRKIERVLIPMIVFIKIAKEDELHVMNYSFIHKFIKNPGSNDLATPIPEDQILNLKYLLENSSTEVFFTNHLKVGDVVKIARGPLKGFEGIISIIDNRTQILAIRIDCLGYACVKISKEFL